MSPPEVVWPLTTLPPGVKHSFNREFMLMPAGVLAQFGRRRPANLGVQGSKPGKVWLQNRRENGEPMIVQWYSVRPPN